MNMDTHNTSTNDVETTDQNEIKDHKSVDEETENLKGTDFYLEKLYTSIVKGDREKYVDAINEVQHIGTVNLSNTTFQGDYVADLHKFLTPLQLVCGKGDECALLELFKLNIDVNYCGKYGKTPLNISCLHGHLSLVKLLISKGADLDASNLHDDCDTALLTSLACYHPELDSAIVYFSIVKLLLESGVNPNKSDKYGISPIFVALDKSDDGLTKLLLSYGANPNTTATDGSSPLCRALEAERYNNAFILLEHGCTVNSEINVDYSCGESALHIAIRNNNLKIILALLNAGANPNCFVRNKKEEINIPGCPLHLAASKDMLVSLWLLLIQGGNVNSQLDIRQDTPLLTLVRLGSVEGVKLMLRFRADVELESRMGTTPIWAAVRENHRKIVQLLLETCCSLEIPSMEYHMYMPLTPLEIALKLQLWNTALTLLNAGANHKISIFKDSIPASVPVREQRITRSRAAYRLSPEDHRALKELRVWRRHPKTLKHICRATLRSYFTLSLPKLLKELTYPIALQKYLFMQE